MTSPVMLFRIVWVQMVPAGWERSDSSQKYNMESKFGKMWTFQLNSDRQVSIKCRHAPSLLVVPHHECIGCQGQIICVFVSFGCFCAHRQHGKWSRVMWASLLERPLVSGGSNATAGRPLAGAGWAAPWDLGHCARRLLGRVWALGSVARVV